MKKILLVGALSGLMASGAFAACPDTSTNAAIAGGAATGGTENTGVCICDGGAARKNTVNGGSGQPNSAPIFIRTGFDVQCSNNTLVEYNEVSSTLLAVAGASKKGNQTFAGNSNGGAIEVSGKCTGTNGVCTGDNVSTALTAKAGSS